MERLETGVSIPNPRHFPDKAPEWSCDRTRFSRLRLLLLVLVLLGCLDDLFGLIPRDLLIM